MSRPPAVPVLVSACLIGRYCRYDGRTNHDRVLEQELEAKGERASHIYLVRARIENGQLVEIPASAPVEAPEG